MPRPGKQPLLKRRCRKLSAQKDLRHQATFRQLFPERFVLTGRNVALTAVNAVNLINRNRLKDLRGDFVWRLVLGMGKPAWDTAEHSPITRDDVERASKISVAALYESFFRVRFDRLTPAEKRYLRAMAELGPSPHRPGDIATEFGRNVTSLAPTRNQLIAKGMIWSPTRGNYCVYGPLIQRIHAPHHARQRMEELKPMGG